MGYKSRGNYGGVCVKDCLNRHKRCEDCFRSCNHLPSSSTLRYVKFGDYLSKEEKDKV
jgi:hypothetical protein